MTLSPLFPSGALNVVASPTGKSLVLDFLPQHDLQWCQYQVPQEMLGHLQRLLCREATHVP